MDDIARGFEWIGVGIIVVSFVVSMLLATRGMLARRTPFSIYEDLRSTFGRGLLLGLEVFVAADLIRTVAVDLTLENVGTLGLLVLVRTVLSFSLDVEIDGVLPWRRGARPQA